MNYWISNLELPTSDKCKKYANVPTILKGLLKVKNFGLLQPVGVSNLKFELINIDFILKLPKT